MEGEHDLILFAFYAVNIEAEMVMNEDQENCSEYCSWVVRLLCGAHDSSDEKHTLREFYDKIHLQIWKTFMFYSKDFMRHEAA